MSPPNIPLKINLYKAKKQAGRYSNRPARLNSIEAAFCIPTDVLHLLFLLIFGHVHAFNIYNEGHFHTKVCQKAHLLFFYAQSPDFHKLGLCYYLKISYL